MSADSSPPPSYEPVPSVAFGEHEAWGEVEQNSETEPFLPGRQDKQAWYRKHRTCITVIALLSFALIGSWVLAASFTNRNLVKWERDLAFKKAQEKIRELEWEGQMAEKHEQEHTREIEWDHRMQETCEQERVRESEWEHQMSERGEQEHMREIEWERQMEEAREQERVRESDWEHQMAKRCEQEHMREMEWERQMEEAREQERARENEWVREMKERLEQERQRQQDWERELQSSRDEWERSIAAKKARERQREQAWESQMEEKREEERVRERQWHLDQAERERLGLHWNQPTAGRCSSHGVRDYRAQLLNAAPYHYNWLEPCMDIPIIIQGKPHNASRCEQNGNEIWGHWSIEGDSLCSPFFEDWRDNGCIAPGSQLRLASARLDYIPSGENGLELCNSTPLRFWDRSFSHPSTCAQQGHDIWGYWEVDDGAC